MEELILKIKDKYNADVKASSEHSPLDDDEVIELIDFLERTFSIKCEDDEIVPDNLDSIVNLERFLIFKYDGASGA